MLFLGVIDKIRAHIVVDRHGVDPIPALIPVGYGARRWILGAIAGRS